MGVPDRIDRADPCSVFGRLTVANVYQTQKISVEVKIITQAYPYDDVVAPMARE